jgi:hypothetical protein
MSYAKHFLEEGNKSPYDEATEGELDWAHKTARGVLFNLNDRTGIRNILEEMQIDNENCTEIVTSLASIIREGEAIYRPKDNDGAGHAVNAALADLVLDTDSIPVNEDELDHSFMRTLYPSDCEKYGNGKRPANQPFAVTVLDEASSLGSISVIYDNPTEGAELCVRMTVSSLPDSDELLPRIHVHDVEQDLALSVYPTPNGFVFVIEADEEIILVSDKEGENPTYKTHFSAIKRHPLGV